MNYELTPARKAMLDTINWAEGSPAYNQLFGYNTFNINGPFPGVKIPFGNTYTTAAGRYQIIDTTWYDSIDALGINDSMIPGNQDQVAMYRIDQRGALNDVDTGNIEDAIIKLSYEWASLPPARYGQSVKNINDLINRYDESLANEKKNSPVVENSNSRGGSNGNWSGSVDSVASKQRTESMKGKTFVWLFSLLHCLKNIFIIN